MGRPPAIGTAHKAETPLPVIVGEQAAHVLALASVFSDVLPDCTKATRDDLAALRRAVNLLEEAIEPFVRARTSTRSDAETTALLRRLVRDATGDPPKEKQKETEQETRLLPGEDPRLALAERVLATARKTFDGSHHAVVVNVAAFALPALDARGLVLQVVVAFDGDLRVAAWSVRRAGTGGKRLLLGAGEQSLREALEKAAKPCP